MYGAGKQRSHRKDKKQKMYAPRIYGSILPRRRRRRRGRGSHIIIIFVVVVAVISRVLRIHFPCGHYFRANKRKRTQRRQTIPF